MAIIQYYVDPDAGNDTTGTGIVGAPWKTVQHALDNITQDTTDGDQINVKAGTEDVLTAALDLTTYGTPAVAYWLHIRGYTSAANDGGIGGISGDGSYTMFANANLDYISLVDMHLHNSGTSQVVRLDNSIYMENCEVDSGLDGIYIDNSCRVINCFVHNIDNYGIRIASNSQIYYSVSRDLAGDTYSMFYGILLAGTYGVAINNIVVMGHTAAHGISAGSNGGSVIMSNTVYSSVAATGIGINATTGNNDVIVASNYIEGFSGTGGDGIYVPSTAVIQTVRNNRVFNCTTAFTTDGAIFATDNSTVSASALAAPGSGDFSVGTDLKAGAYPTTFKGISTDQFMDIGAAQREEPAGGGGTTGRQGLHSIEAGAV